MSQHFTSIFENLRFVTIKRTPNAQQQQQQQQQSPLPTARATTVEQNKIKVKAQAAPQLNGNGLLSTNLKGISTACHEVDHNNSRAVSDGASGSGLNSGTPLKHPKRTSISTVSPQAGRERRGTNTSIVVELEDGPASAAATGAGQGPSAVAAVAAASGSGTASSKSSRELSPTPKNQQPRKMSQDYRSRAGSFMHLDDEGRSLLMRKPMRLKNIEGRPEVYDTLHSKGREILSCTRATCTSSIMNIGNAAVEARKSDLVLEHAKDFLDQYFTSIKRSSSAAHETRWKQVRQSIETTGHYQLTETELIYGAKLAWRNSSRCIGRIQWSKLQVFDCRYVTTTSGMFEAICNHIKYATNKGNLRSAITIFPQRTDAKHDYRIWNNQLISYAGYKQTDGKIIGDPMNVEFTEVCTKLGWKGKGSEWDILPLVVSANGHDPDYFDYPPELILEVPLSHPKFEWFSDLGLRWYALPAVSSMLFDVGGIQFTATTFSGWYMSTEIGCRNLCDTNRRNMLETVALKMNLDTRTPTSLWKDKAVVEMNIAVLHSYQSRNVTIVDHHTASESFMKHFENESKLRNGCPADWIWIVPPLSGSITPVFHQEMALYYLKPSFEYQDPAWRTHVWKKGRGESKGKKPRRKFNFKQIARAVKFTSKLFGRALSKRIKATVLYATETGKSEQYAKQLCELLGHAFNAQIYCMSDYDISSIEHEALLIVVASTFGNGDPPENGELFSQDLYAMRVQESGEHGLQDSSMGVTSSKSFMKASSRQDFMKLPLQQVKKIDRWDSLRGSTSDTFTDETFGPLSNVRFAVFALGSSAYPNFCAFGQYVDNILGELGGERLLKIAYGDEMCGQEQSFRKWAPEVFKLACETFCLDPDQSLSDASLALQNESLTVNTVRLVPSVSKVSLDSALSKYHNKKVHCCKIKAQPHNLTKLSEGAKTTMLLEICAPGLEYEPGDHVGIFPANRSPLVEGLLGRLVGVENPDEVLQLQLLKEKQTSNGIFKCWEPHDKIPADTLRNLLARFFDLTTPPSRQLLTLLAGFCDDNADKERLELLVTDSSAYEDWRHWRLPHLLDVLEEFPSCRPPASLVLAHLTPLQPRFYSISSSPRRVSDEIHLTVAIVKYRSEDGQGDERFGVCSNYLASLRSNDELFMFVRSALGFHLPTDRSCPVVLIGPGTGIAPFRSFWQEIQVLREVDTTMALPKVWLFFGCRNRDVDLYAEEKAQLLQDQILDRVFLALSRESDIPKTYVQDLIEQEFDSLYNLIVLQRGHVYVCGDVTMAEHVYQTIRKCIAGKEQKSEAEVETFLLTLRDENRYHEDIFGITLRTAEIHTKSRATARIRMASQP
ncbi:nitric oxide synthase isoform X1 [Drosophila albomicans]|uniref:Nitric oxide synthase n=3 Tax=Drosophila albomicans TaxID=7291 RepID=A0A6P8XQK7_DROAB|nr:nitric oxide synthase isoform X1 [Drosophila albomicans]